MFRAGDIDERDMWVSAILDVLKEVAHVDSSGMAEGIEAPPTLMYVLPQAWIVVRLVTTLAVHCCTLPSP